MGHGNACRSAPLDASDGEVLLTADTTQLSRYNDEVVAAYRTTVAFEESMRGYHMHMCMCMLLCM